MWKIFAFALSAGNAYPELSVTVYDVMGHSSFFEVEKSAVMSSGIAMLYFFVGYARYVHVLKEVTLTSVL